MHDASSCKFNHSLSAAPLSNSLRGIRITGKNSAASILHSLSVYPKKRKPRRSAMQTSGVLIQRWAFSATKATEKRNYSSVGFFLSWCLAKRLLNLSTRPAVSTNFIFPVKKGCDLCEISILTRGYSFPSSHFTVSLLDAQLRVINE